MNFYVKDDKFIIETEDATEGVEEFREGDLIRLHINALCEYTKGTPKYDLLFFDDADGCFALYRVDGHFFAKECEEVYIERICPEYITLVNQNLPFDVNILLSLDEAAVAICTGAFCSECSESAEDVTGGINACDMCDNARINPELTDDNDFASFDIGETADGFRVMASVGYGRPLRIEFEKWDEKTRRWVEVGRYYPDHCPNCGRKITEYNKKDNDEAGDKEHGYTEYAVEVYNSHGFNRQLDVFGTYEEAEKFAKSYDEKLDADEYLNIVCIEYDKNDNEISMSTIFSFSKEDSND